MAENVQFYCLNYKNSKRRERMRQQFSKAGIKIENCIFHYGVQHNDPRLNYTNDPHKKKIGSNIYGHLDNLSHFLHHTEKQWVILCEDDILFHKQFMATLPGLIKRATTQNIDLLLLGYLLPYRLPEEGHNIIDGTSFSLRGYTDELWGSQMCMMSRAHAKTIWEKYGSPDYDHTSGKPFAADFTLTKDASSRMLVYPPLAMEHCMEDDLSHFGGDLNQQMFHQQCFRVHYDPEKYIST